LTIDTLTTLSGVPNEVWEYKLGTYSARGWILDRYKEKNQDMKQLGRSSMLISFLIIRRR